MTEQEKGRISPLQVALLVIFLVLPTAILFLPGIVAELARQDAWLVGLVSMVEGMGLALLLLAVLRQYPRRTLLQIAEEALGRWPGKAVGALYLFYFLHVGAIIIREFAELMVTAVMPETPIEAFVFTFAWLAAWAVKSGLEVLGRMGEFLILILALAVLVVVLPALQERDFLEVLPIMEYGPLPVLRASLIPLSWMGEVVVLGQALAFLNRPEAARPVVLSGLLLTGIVVSGSAILVIGLFGPHHTAILTFPFLEAARFVRISDFIEHIEGAVVGLWVGGMFMKLCLFLYALVLGSAQWLELPDYRPLALPWALALGFLSLLLFPNIMELQVALGGPEPLYAVSVFQLGLPLVLWLASRLRQRGRRPRPS